MSEYVMSVVAVSILSTLCVLLSYGGGAEKSIRAALSMILIYTVCVPVISCVKDFSVDKIEIGSYDGCAAEDSEYYKTAEESFCKGIALFVSEEFTVNADDVSVTLEKFDFEKMKAEKINVFLHGRAISADSRAIEERISEYGFGKCEVEIIID